MKPLVETDEIKTLRKVHLFISNLVEGYDCIMDSPCSSEISKLEQEYGWKN